MVMTLLVAAAAIGAANQGDMALHPEHISVALPRACSAPRLEINESTGAVGVSVQLNERVLSSSSSYLLRALHSSFAAGSKVALHLNFTKKTYAGMEALMSHASVPSSHFKSKRGKEFYRKPRKHIIDVNRD